MVHSRVCRDACAALGAVRGSGQSRRRRGCVRSRQSRREVGAVCVRHGDKQTRAVCARRERDLVLEIVENELPK